MELLLLVGAIVILGIWTGWQEYQLNKIREELDRDDDLLRKHDHAIYGDFSLYPFHGQRDGKSGIFYRLGVIERKLRAKENLERIAHRKAEMKEHIFNNDAGIEDTDKLINELYDMAHGLSTAETECEEEEE